jgi:hypothetical protein
MVFLPELLKSVAKIRTCCPAPVPDGGHDPFLILDAVV